MFHASGNRNDFLGIRTSRRGDTEIVYDNGAQTRLVWRVPGPLQEQPLAEALETASTDPQILPALMSELAKRDIRFEPV